MIDSLCIIQDSDTDKATEISRMRKIYKDSSLTILAAAASNANEGFLDRPPINPPYYYELPYICPDGSTGTMLLRPWSTDTDYDPVLDPVNTRAWIFQERMLSKRLLIYPPSPHPMQWQCQTSQLANGGPPCNIENASLQGLSSQIRAQSASTNHDKSNLALLRTWTKLLYNYSDRAMSDSRDKLPAIAGVAEELYAIWDGQTSGLKYYAGLWSCDLVRGLLWKVFSPKPPPPQKRPNPAPTRCGAASNRKNFFNFINSHPVPYHFEILACEILLRDPSFPFGEVEAGTLKVRGVTKEAEWRVRQGRLLEPDIEEGAEEAVVGIASTDNLEFQPSRQKVVCLLVVDPAKCEAEPFYVLGLVLWKKDDGRYERRGGFGLNKRDWFLDGRCEVLEIV